MIPPAHEAKYQKEELTLSLDAFVRSIGINRSTVHALFLGAGASISSGVPSAEKCIWEWKRSIFTTNNPGLENQFSELSLPSVQHRIQNWLDRQGIYPMAGSPKEYGFYIQHCFPISTNRRAYFQDKVRTAKPHVGYRLLCHLAQADLFRSTWSTNFDGLAARASANFHLTPIESASTVRLACRALRARARYSASRSTGTTDTILSKTHPRSCKLRKRVSRMRLSTSFAVRR